MVREAGAPNSVWLFVWPSLSTVHSDPIGVLLSRSRSSSAYPEPLKSCWPCVCPPRVLPRPEKLEIGRAMRLDQVTRQLPVELFTYKLHKGSREGDVKKSFSWIYLCFTMLMLISFFSLWFLSSHRQKSTVTFHRSSSRLFFCNCPDRVVLIVERISVVSFAQYCYIIYVIQVCWP